MRLGLGFAGRGDCLTPEECRSLLGDLAAACARQNPPLGASGLVCRAPSRDLAFGFEAERPCAAVCFPLVGPLEGWASWVTPWCPIDPPTPPSEGLVEQARLVVRTFLDGVFSIPNGIELDQPIAALDSAASIEGALAALMKTTVPLVQLVATISTPEDFEAHLHIQCPLETLRSLRASFLEECA